LPSRRGNRQATSQSIKLADLQMKSVEFFYTTPQTHMDSDQPSAGFSISNLLGFDRRSESHNNNQQQNLSEKTG